MDAETTVKEILVLLDIYRESRDKMDAALNELYSMINHGEKPPKNIYELIDALNELNAEVGHNAKTKKLLESLSIDY